MILISIGGPLLVGVSFFHRFNDGRTEAVQKEVVDSIVANDGPPPGFKIYTAMPFPWPLSDKKGVLYVPESAQGELDTVLNSSDTFAVLFQTADSERDRAARDRIFREGQMGPPPFIAQFLRSVGADAGDPNANKVDIGSLPGHRFPLPYFIKNEPEPPDRDPNQTGRRRRGRGQNGSMAGVDLTPPGTTDRATMLWVFRSTSAPITAPFLEEFCRNFRPGE
jgi:hypothetical protein